jgi:hypothetical protein
MWKAQKNLSGLVEAIQFAHLFYGVEGESQ